MAALRLALLLAGCTPCKRSSVFLDLTFAGGSSAAAMVEAVVSLDGAPEQRKTFGRRAALTEDSIEVDLPNYLAGGKLSVRVDAIVDDVRVGSGARTLTLADQCMRASLTIDKVSCSPQALSDPVFVDPSNGSDDLSYGGGEGLCANRRLSFALLSAPGLIRLAPGVYQPPVETLPLKLSGNQHIDCNKATIRGGGLFVSESINATLLLAGAANQLENCIIEGGPNVIICVDVISPGQHSIDNCDISQCPGTIGKGSAIQVDLIGGDGLTVTNSRFSDTFFGLDWSGGAHSGTMTNNVFENIRGYDIACTDADDDTNPAVIGSDNSHSATAIAPCVACSGCPF